MNLRFSLFLSLAVAVAACADPSPTASTKVPTVSADMTGYPTVAAPSNLTAEMTADGLLLTWTDNSDNETAFNVRFTDPVTGAIVKTWHVDANQTSVVIPVVGSADQYGIQPGTYNVTLYAAGYYVSTDPSLPSTNLWSGPSNTVSIEVTQGKGNGKGHGKGKP